MKEDLVRKGSSIYYCEVLSETQQEEEKQNILTKFPINGKVNLKVLKLLAIKKEVKLIEFFKIMAIF